jgi:hypothetical protein
MYQMYVCPLLLRNYFTYPPHRLQKRVRLPYSTIDDAVNLIKKSKNILVLSGAGISMLLAYLEVIDID